MTQHQIGKLRRVPLREVWKHEARDFTQWLQNNIDVLNEALDLNLLSADREQAAGTFSVDLVAEDESGGTVIIENQLGKSDHDHLGKLITYLTAMRAKAAIWIVSDPRPEHIAAITWLNEANDADFYLVKMEAVRIEDSPAAPLLTIIVAPSLEGKTIGHQKKELAERHDMRRKWWENLVARPDAKLHAHITPSISSWISVTSGIRGLSFTYVVNQDESYAELYIDRGKDADDENKKIFDQLESAKPDIQKVVIENILWERLEGRRSCRIRIVLPGGWRSPESEWPALQARLVAAMNSLNKALMPEIKKLKLGGGAEGNYVAA